MSLSALPLVTLYVTDRCNSRCVSCDYWRHGRTDMSLDTLRALLPSFERLGTQVVVLSGGEPLLNPQWADIALALRDAGLKVWLLTAGLALAKHARRAAGLFDNLTVSLDASDSKTYLEIRGVNAFSKVCEGIRLAAQHGMPCSLRVTLQRANHRDLSKFVVLAKELGAKSVSFLAVDVANSQAFGRESSFVSDLALRPDDLAAFEQALNDLERDHAADFRSGFILETREKLRRIHRYFTALLSLGEFPAVRCNAPEFSAVIGTSGRVQPCFFIAGPESRRAYDLSEQLNSPEMTALRSAIRDGGRHECKTCVCTLWRDPGSPIFPASPVLRRPVPLHS